MKWRCLEATSVAHPGSRTALPGSSWLPLWTAQPLQEPIIISVGELCTGIWIHTNKLTLPPPLSVWAEMPGYEQGGHTPPWAEQMDTAMPRREPEWQWVAKSVQAGVHAELLSLLVHCQGSPGGSYFSSPLRVESTDFLLCLHALMKAL